MNAKISDADAQKKQKWNQDIRTAEKQYVEQRREFERMKTAFENWQRDFRLEWAEKNNHFGIVHTQIITLIGGGQKTILF
ncbi:hypothetical protein pb186bvf_016679 [Paramecium bursaria]